jgi:cobyrinic acid a,c-diamide synthase
VKGLVVAGTQSGVGKTTLTLGLMYAWRRLGLMVQPFKVGPDFIDPGHHSRAAGRPSHNLDGWMLSQEENLRIFHQHTKSADLAVVEGVMGLFDGYDGKTEAGSTAQMAKWLGLPTLLIVDARSMARSAAALVQGFATFDPDLALAGVVFNRVAGPSHLSYLTEAMELVPQVRCFGGLPRENDLAIPERHLGLATTEDHPLAEKYLEDLADLAAEHLDLEALWQALPEVTRPQVADLPRVSAPRVRLGVARDQAFCFYYPENLEWLRYFGAELVEFSPLDDAQLPPGLAGLYLGGGYPELHAGRLAANTGLLEDLKHKARAGLPIYAECGGLMYLSEEIQDLSGDQYAMVGAVPLKVRMLPRLKSLGYREVTLTADCLLGPAGRRARGHEFHYSEIISEPAGLSKLYQLTPRRGGNPAPEGYSVGQVLASYVHLHFGSSPEVARHFVDYCRRFKENK